MSKKDKIISYRSEKRYFNIVGAVFFLIFIYLIVQIYFFYTKDKISIYELQEAAQYAADPEYTGIITREERIVTVLENTYVNYSVREEHKVSVGTTIYTTENAEYFTDALVQQYSNAEILSTSAITSLKSKLVKAARRDAAQEFDLIYQDKEELQVTVFDSFLLAASETLGELISSEEHCVRTPDSGYILFRSDSYDGLQPSDISAEMFDRKNYSSRIYGTGENRPAGAFAYKLIPDDTFSVTFPISEYDAVRYYNKSSLQIELPGIDTPVNAAFSLHTGKDGTQLATVTVKKYGSSFLTERFLQFKIVEDSVYGYKIPKSAVLTKDYLVVPESYVYKKGATPGVFKEITRDNGKDDTIFVEISVYAKTGSSYYIASSQLQEGDYLVFANGTNDTEWIPDPSKRYLLSVRAPLTGVYNINRGYCVFRQIQILGESNDTNYYIIDTGTSYGLSPFDRIILNAGLVEENQIIY